MEDVGTTCAFHHYICIYTVCMDSCFCLFFKHSCLHMQIHKSRNIRQEMLTVKSSSSVFAGGRVFKDTFPLQSYTVECRVISIR